MPSLLRIAVLGLIVSLSGCHAPLSSDVSSVDDHSSQKIDSSAIAETWEGWGTSLAWWGKAVGDSNYQDFYADLMFGKDIVQAGSFGSIPSLGLNIVRYNVGGGGVDQDVPGTIENNPTTRPWYKDIDGYWENWNSDSPDSDSFDWTRDAEQRSMVIAAKKRGVDKVEFFSNAPMWWMMDSKSSAGGKLQKWNQRSFAVYLATVVAQADKKWGIKATSVVPFNEPSAGWWNYPKAQEGCNIPVDEQLPILAMLREELDKRNVTVPIASADENTMQQALNTFETYKTSQVAVSGKQTSVSELISKVNVHSYNGIQPWRDNNKREMLRNSLSGKAHWMSEYGDGDGSGAELAQTIMEDVNYLQPSAWIYWQVVEKSSGWGMVNADFGSGTQAKDRGGLTHVYNKHYVMAHFSRYIRPGMKIISQADSSAILALDSSAKTLNIVLLNRSDAVRNVAWDLSDFHPVVSSYEMSETRFDSTVQWLTSRKALDNESLQLALEPQSIVSLTIRLQ